MMGHGDALAEVRGARTPLYRVERVATAGQAHWLRVLAASVTHGTTRCNYALANPGVAQPRDGLQTGSVDHSVACHCQE